MLKNTWLGMVGELEEMAQLLKVLAFPEGLSQNPNIHIREPHTRL